MRFISMGGGHTQLYFGTRLDVAPQFQFGANDFGPFSHAAQAKVPGASVGFDNLRFDAFAVIPNSQPQLMSVVVEFDLDAARLSVAKRVAKGLTSNAVELISNKREELAGRTLNRNIENGRSSVSSSTQLLSQGFDGHR
jgi:hypothetical protein